VGWVLLAAPRGRNTDRAAGATPTVRDGRPRSHAETVVS